MPTTPSTKQSKISTPKPIIWLGVGVLAWLLLSVAASYIIRANRGVISSEIARIKSLPQSEQQAALQKLVIATGNDQEASRALANYYISRGDYALGASAYLAAQPELRLEAAQAYAKAYDFQKVSDLRRIDTKSTKGDEWQVLQQTATLNLNPTDLGICENIGQQSAFDALRNACDVLKNSQSSKEDVYALVDNGFPLVAANRLESQKAKSSTDYLLIAQIYARKGETDRDLSTLEAGFQAVPYDKLFLTESKLILEQLGGGDSIARLKEKVRMNLSLLPSQ